MFVYLLHSIMVADGSNQSILYATNFILVRLLSSSRIRRFLIFDIVDNIADKTSRFLVVDDLDDAFDAAENNDGDINGDEFVDDREETVDGVERDGRDTTTDKPTTLAMVGFFLFATANDLPCFVFVGGLLSLFAMLATDAGFVVFGQRVVELTSSLEECLIFAKCVEKVDHME